LLENGMSFADVGQQSMLGLLAKEQMAAEKQWARIAGTTVCFYHRPSRVVQNHLAQFGGAKVRSLT